MDPQQRRFLRFLLTHLAYGSIGGFTFGGLLLWFDIAHLWTMITGSPDWPLYLLLLFFGLFITFGSIGMAVGIMQLGDDRD
jgi:tetrahydromethanopterin S-methyltransferase subunit E